MRHLSLFTLLLLTCSILCSGCEKKNLEVEKTPEKTEPKDSDKNTIQDKEEEEEETLEEDNPETTFLQTNALFKKLINGVLRGEKEIDIHEFNIRETEADSIYKQFLADNPLLFHLKISGNIGYRTDQTPQNYLRSFLPMYAVNTNYIQEIYPRMEESIEDYYSLLDYRMKPAEIAYSLYQKICKEVVYGERNNEATYLANSAFSAIGAFLLHKAVCQGYSLSFFLLMNGMGITTDYVTGHIPGSSGHMWNRIYIDGDWYHADATFDDGSNSLTPHLSTINKFFLCSDDLFYNINQHPEPHFNLPKRIYIKSGNKFDNEKCVIRRYNKRGKIIKTEARYSDGSWYYLSTENEKMQIIKSDFEGKQMQILRQQNLSSSVGNIDKLKFTQDRIYFLDYLDGSYHICSMNYDGNDFRKEKKISFIEASSDNLKLTQDESQPIHVYKGTVSLKAELMLARLKLLYYHGEDDYFNLEQPQAKELEQLIRKAETFLNDKHTDETQADMLAKELKDKRKSYTVPLSIKP